MKLAGPCMCGALDCVHCRGPEARAYRGDDEKAGGCDGCARMPRGTKCSACRADFERDQRKDGDR